MIALSVLLVGSALVLLVVGLLAGTPPLIWGSVGASLAAAGALAIEVGVRRRGGSGR